ncbi:Polymerase/histidinol phosphatase-like protein [Podospora didyma]|uniref:Histidinol-phosphatase n=1 Tax=Podospora didyma TaxID=330526 RepID=A0AAE0U433_9PEZI|nr:Polymerase/histidinol phosphatase-like protein [Podospora didyma]
MAFTMHSHSGQFCPGHAKDQLEDIVLHAISIGYKTMGLTEHMPRTELSDLYPEELDTDPHASLAELAPRHEAYLVEAQRLQAKYASQIHILIGIESEFIRASYGPLIEKLAAPACIDYILGSIHHTAGIPIDFDKAMYIQAKDACGGLEMSLYQSYFDEQWVMLQELKPRVVGHFDLIRLLSDDPARDLKSWDGGRLWEKVLRNLELVASYGGWLECNTSALRKGLADPYPARPIAEEWVKIGGKFTFSDDSHGIAQVATNYIKGLDYLESLGVKEVWTLERTLVEAEKHLREKSVAISDFRESLRLE